MKPTYGWYHRDPLTGEHLFHFSRYSRIEVINLVERAWDVIITVVSCDRNTINRRTNETQGRMSYLALSPVPGSWSF